MGSGSFPVDLILFGMIAAFLVLRLRSILGRRTGYERPPQPVQPQPVPRAAPGPVIDGRAEPVRPAAPQTVPDTDASFDPTRFLAGVDQAFRMIVAAFAQGDRVTLRSLLADDTYKAFEGAITARETANETQVSEIKSIQQLAIEAAELKGRSGLITVRIVSDQVSYAHDMTGKPVAGTDAVTEITDIWTFERDLTSQDPTWRLVAARSG
jgi:predicted lipid-binding transport protein (Tim44 family)